MLIQSDGRPDEEPNGYAAQNYSLTFSVDYPERLSRLKTAFRLILVIPILVVVAVLVGSEAIGGGRAHVVRVLQRHEEAEVVEPPAVVVAERFEGQPLS